MLLISVILVDIELLVLPSSNACQNSHRTNSNGSSTTKSCFSEDAMWVGVRQLISFVACRRACSARRCCAHSIRSTTRHTGIGEKWRRTDSWSGATGWSWQKKWNLKSHFCFLFCFVVPFPIVKRNSRFFSLSLSNHLLYKIQCRYVQIKIKSLQ